MTRTIPRRNETEVTTYLLDVARARRTQRLRDRYLLRHIPLAYSLARRYAGRHGTEQELIAVANLGLVRAVEEFDPMSGAPFAPLAEAQIVAELEDFIQDQHAEGDGARRISAQDAAVAGAGRAVAEAVGRQPHVRDLAGFLDCEVDTLVDGLMTAVQREPHLIASPAAREQPQPGAAGYFSHR